MSVTDGEAVEPLGSRAAGGVLWGVVQKWAQRLGGLITVAILARLLAPADFGVVAVAASFIPIIYLLSDLGFSTYIVQSRDASTTMLSTAFWFSATAGALLCAAVVLSAPLIATLLRIPEASAVIAGVAPSILLVGLSSVPISIMRRRMEFRALAIQSGVAAALGQVAAVILAVAGAGVWALVVQLLINHLVVAVLSARFARFRPHWTFSREHFLAMTKFGTNVTAVQFVAMARLWAETAIITLSLGVTGLGYLNLAQRLVQTAQDLSSAAVVPVSTVVFAHLRDAAHRLTRAYQRALETIYLVVMPLMIILAVGASHVIPLAFGPNWDESVPPTRALAIAAIFTLGASLDLGLFYGSGRPGRWLGYALIIDGLTVATTAYAVQFGIVGVSLGFVGVAVCATFARWFMVAHLLKVRVSAVIRPFVKTSVPALVSAGVGVLVYVWTTDWSHFAALAAIAVSVGTAQLLATRVFAPTLFDATLELLRERLPRRLARRGTPSDDGGSA